jgi:hypothetical protein
MSETIRISTDANNFAKEMAKLEKKIQRSAMKNAARRASTQLKRDAQQYAKTDIAERIKKRGAAARYARAIISKVKKYKASKGGDTYYIGVGVQRVPMSNSTLKKAQERAKWSALVNIFEKGARAHMTRRGAHPGFKGTFSWAEARKKFTAKAVKFFNEEVKSQIATLRSKNK